MKNNNGVTLMALTIIIIVLLIITSVATYSGLNTLKDAKENAKLSELGIIQQAVIENYTKYKLTKNNMYIRGDAVDYNEVNNLATEMNVKLLITSAYTIESDQKSTSYYYRLEKNDLEEMDISQVEDSYIVNYETGEVLNETQKKTSTGKALYIYATESK
jgi:Tfp pilus assembly protein PilE